MDTLQENCEHKIIKAEKTTDLPECESICFDIGKRNWLLLHYHLLQVAHRSIVLDVDRKWVIRHTENPTEERDGANWAFHRRIRSIFALARPCVRLRHSKEAILRSGLAGQSVLLNNAWGGRYY
jgi:hypothetical protein